MSWVDLAVIAIVLTFSLIGIKRGLILSIFKLISFYVAIFIAIKLYPVITDILMKTSLYEYVKMVIYNNLLAKGSASAPGVESITAVVEGLPLPQFLKNLLIVGGVESFEMGYTKAVEMISGQLAFYVISVISLVFLFVVVWLCLMLLKFLIKGITQLPVLKQLDKIGGFAFGTVEGILTIFVIMTVLTLFNSHPQFTKIFEAIDNSVIAKYFFEHNFIMNWMFSRSAEDIETLLKKTL